MKGSLFRTASNSWDRIWHAESYCGMYDNGRTCVCVCFLCGSYAFVQKCVYLLFQGTKLNSIKLAKSSCVSVWVFKDKSGVSQTHLPPLFSLWPTYTHTLALTQMWTHTCAGVSVRSGFWLESLFAPRVLYVWTESRFDLHDSVNFEVQNSFCSGLEMSHTHVISLLDRHCWSNHLLNSSFLPHQCPCWGSASQKKDFVIVLIWARRTFPFYLASVI